MTLQKPEMGGTDTSSGKPAELKERDKKRVPTGTRGQVRYTGELGRRLLMKWTSFSGSLQRKGLKSKAV